MTDLEKIEQKLEKIDEKMDNIERHLAVYNAQLRFHIKRTDMLESEVKPLKIHLHKVQGVLTFVGVIATIITVIVTIYNLGSIR
jgi:Mg2+ and Co2+ transporter CorA